MTLIMVWKWTSCHFFISNHLFKQEADNAKIRISSLSLSLLLFHVPPSLPRTALCSREQNKALLEWRTSADPPHGSCGPGRRLMDGPLSHLSPRPASHAANPTTVRCWSAAEISPAPPHRDLCISRSAHFLPYVRSHHSPRRPSGRSCCDWACFIIPLYHGSSRPADGAAEKLRVKRNGEWHCSRLFRLCVCGTDRRRREMKKTTFGLFWVLISTGGRVHPIRTKILNDPGGVGGKVTPSGFNFGIQSCLTDPVFVFISCREASLQRQQEVLLNSSQ